MEHVTSGPGDATEVTRQALKGGVKRVVAVGGDGTVNEVLNGYFDLDGIPHNRDGDIALVPGGNGNDFRRSLGFQSWGDAVATLARPQSDLLNAAVAAVTGLDGGEVFSLSAQFREKQAQQVWVTSDDPMPVEIVGEVAGMTPAHFRILPSAVRFVT